MEIRLRDGKEGRQSKRLGWKERIREGEEEGLRRKAKARGKVKVN